MQTFQAAIILQVSSPLAIYYPQATPAPNQRITEAYAKGLKCTQRILRLISQTGHFARFIERPIISRGRDQCADHGAFHSLLFLHRESNQVGSRRVNVRVRNLFCQFYTLYQTAMVVRVWFLTLDLFFYRANRGVLWNHCDLQRSLRWVSQICVYVNVQFNIRKALTLWQAFPGGQFILFYRLITGGPHLK